MLLKTVDINYRSPDKMRVRASREHPEQVGRLVTVTGISGREHTPASARRDDHRPLGGREHPDTGIVSGAGEVGGHDTNIGRHHKREGRAGMSRARWPKGRRARTSTTRSTCTGSMSPRSPAISPDVSG